MSLSPFDTRWFGSKGGFSDDRPFIAGSFEGERILVPLLTPAVPTITDQIKVASTLARARDASLRIINPIEAPEQTPRGVWREIVDENDHGLLEWALDEALTSTPEVRGSFSYSRHLIEAVLHSISAYDIDTVVLPSVASDSALRRNVNERISARAECDVLVVNGQPGYETVPSVLLPVAGGPHSGLAADIAAAIATEYDAWIDILHVVGEDPPNDRKELANEFVDATYQRIARPETTTTWILEAEDTAEAIVDQSRYYNLTVLGAPTVGKLHRLIYGSTNREIRTDARSVVLSVRNNRNPSSLLEAE